jgi:hypothetical protein
MSDPTTSPSPTPKNSSDTFANDPLVALLKRPFHQKSPDEQRSYANELRTKRCSAQSLGKMLRQEGEESEVKDKKARARTKTESVDDLLKSLEES